MLEKTWQQIANEVLAGAKDLAYAILRDEQDAEDAVQDFKLQLERMRQGLVNIRLSTDSEESWRAFLKKTLLNKILEARRKRHKVEPLPSEDMVQDDNPDDLKKRRLMEELTRALNVLVSLEDADSEKGHALARQLAKLTYPRESDVELCKTLGQATNDLDKRTWRFRIFSFRYKDEMTLKVIAAQIGKATGRSDISHSWIDHLLSDTGRLLRKIAYAKGLDLWLPLYPQLDED